MIKKMINYGFIQTQKEKNQEDNIIKRGQHHRQKALQDITGGILNNSNKKKLRKFKVNYLFPYRDFQANLPNEPTIIVQSIFSG